MVRKNIVCRCEEISKEEIIAAIKEGARSIDSVKKKTRAGMGYCQGKTCKKLIARLLFEYADVPMEESLPGSIRSPVGPISISVLADEKGAG